MAINMNYLSYLKFNKLYEHGYNCGLHTIIMENIPFDESSDEYIEFMKGYHAGEQCYYQKLEEQYGH